GSSVGPNASVRLGMSVGSGVSVQPGVSRRPWVPAVASTALRLRAAVARATDLRATPLVAAAVGRGDELTKAAGSAPAPVCVGASVVTQIAAGASVAAVAGPGPRDEAGVGSGVDVSMVVGLDGALGGREVGAGGLASLAADAAT